MRPYLSPGSFLASLLLLVAAFSSGCSPAGNTIGIGEVVEDSLGPDLLRDLVPEQTDTDLPGIDLAEETRDLPPDCPEEFQPCLWCETVADCDGHFTDVGLCEVVVCHPEHLVCAVVSADEDSSCDDGDLCNGLELCRTPVGGDMAECMSGEPLDCGDDDPCNGEETCDPEVGCAEGEALVCDDADLCNGEETCVEGEGCSEGEPLECDDEEPCNGEETCDPVEGCLEGEPLVCSDEDTCNGLEECIEGEGCQDGDPLSCDDGDLCNGLETCDAELGCVEAEALECDDGDACNGEEGCDALLGCTLGKALTCGDNTVCNGLESCDPGLGCVPGTPADCDDNNTCTDDTCFPASGCAHLPNGSPGCCENDGDCEDNNPCTVDSCSSGTKACLHAAAPGECDDNDPCTAGDTCVDSECVPGLELPNCSVVCMLSGDAGSVVGCDTGLARRDEGDAPAAALEFALAFEQATLVGVVDQVCLDPDNCTDISITESGASLFESGHTVYFAPTESQPWSDEVEVSLLNAIDPEVPISLAWYDANDLVSGDAHLLGLNFKLAQDIGVDEAIPVVLHSVFASDGTGQSLAIATVEGMVVTADDGCGGTLHHCFDARQCTKDVCEPGDGSCGFEAQEGPCDDGNTCTLNEFCDDVGDCVALNPAPEGTGCTGDDLCDEVGECDGVGACFFSPDLSVVCDPAPSDCAAYKCKRDTGICVLAPYAIGTACSDDLACTQEDGCNGNGQCVGVVTDCDDQVSCTADSCSANDGSCKNTPDSDLCQDGNQCTVNTCDPQDGCVTVSLNAGACDDGDACTLQDACTAGVCGGQWDAAKCGCDKTADCAGLEDGNPCTGTYFCSEGSCVVVPNSVVTCSEYAGDCTFWDCNPLTGECAGVEAPEGTECDDGGCLVDPSCNDAGLCVGGEVDCDDGDACTVDACVPDQGCSHAALPDCESKYCVCEVAGDSGSQVECPMLLLRETESTGAPVGTDFKLQWDSAVMDLTGFADEVCMGPICLPKTIPTCQPGGISCVWGSLFPSGHNIVAVPKQLADWEDQGTLLFFHPGDPFKKLTDAWLDDGNVEGDPLYLTSNFTLQQDVSLDEPVCLWMASPHFSLANGLTLSVKIETIDAGSAVVVY